VSFGHGHNVRVFGAKGDWNEGSQTGTDDTLAIQAAIDRSLLVGGPVIIPPGTYKITQRPSVIYALQLRTNAHLVGLQRPTLRIVDDHAPPTSAPDYHALNADGGERRIRIEGIRFQGNNSPYDRAEVTGANAAISITGGAGGINIANYDFELLNCEFENLMGFAFHGIWEGSYNVRVSGNRIRQCSNGLNVNAAGQITDNYFEDTPGIEHFSPNVLIANNRFRRATNVAIAIAGGGTSLDGFICKGNVIESTVASDAGHDASGIIVGAGVRNCLLADNVLLDIDYIGLLIQGGGIPGPPPVTFPPPENVVIDGLLIRNCGNSGVVINSTPKQVSVANAHVTKCAIHALHVADVDGLWLRGGNYWRTDNSNQYDWNLGPAAKNLRIEENNDFRRGPSVIDPAATMLWY
jgi:hypothetical protein